MRYFIISVLLILLSCKSEKEVYLNTSIWCKSKPNLETYLAELFPETTFFEKENPVDFDRDNPNHSFYTINYQKDALYPYEITLERLDKTWSHFPIYKLAEHIARTENNECLAFAPKVYGISHYPQLLFKNDTIFSVKLDSLNNPIKLKKIQSIYD